MIKWNPAEYAAQSSQQQLWARELMAKLKLQGRESILDIGCGDGKVTAELARGVPEGRVVGIDSSPEMVAFSSRQFGGQGNLRFEVADARALPFDGEFDLVFSNAVLHWVHDHRPVLAGIRRSLKAGGRVMLQMGGKGNAADMLSVVQRLMREGAWSPYFRDFAFRYGFHGPQEYDLWLKEAALRPVRVELIPKVMVHASAAAYEGWLRTTWMPYIDPVPAPLQDQWVQAMAQGYLAEHPADATGQVSLRVVRLEVEAEAV